MGNCGSGQSRKGRAGMKNLSQMQRDVTLLRQSAEALVDQGEPAWGLAQGLLELVGRAVQASGQHPALFGVGLPLSERQVALLGAEAPECCSACGHYNGQHLGWCTERSQVAENPFAAEQPAWLAGQTPEQPLPPLAVHYEGCCPRCHSGGELVHVDREQFIVCRDHRLAWHIGSNLYSGWRNLTPEQQAENRRFLECCEIIDPPDCTCTPEPDLSVWGEVL